MSFAENFLPEFTHEMNGTKSVLALVPQSLLDWKAHQNLNTIGWVASHLVDTMSWTDVIVTGTEFDVAPIDGPPHKSPLFENAADLAPAFEENFANAVDIIGKASDEDFAVNWTLKQGGKPLFTMPRAAVTKTFLLNHIIHHRAFLVAYLRMNDIECPGLYS